MTLLDSLKKDEQFIVNELQSKFEKLSPEAQAVVAEGVSWAHRNFWPMMGIVAVFFWALGHFIL